MTEFDKVERLNDAYLDGSKKETFQEDRDIFDEGIFGSESNGEDEDDGEYFTLREPKTEFEKSISKIDNVIRQIDEDTQLLSHDLKTLETKNESTERRIRKLLRDAEQFKLKLNSFLSGRRIDIEDGHGDTTSPLPRFHKATLNVLLKQNSIEQPVHVNIAVR